jgi:hypothetical protein
VGFGPFLFSYHMKKTNVDFNPDDLLRQMPKDFSQYMEDRLSTKQLEQATTLIYNDPEMKRIADEKLQNAFYYWEKLQPFRQRRKKCRDFYQGDHWKDTMTNPDTGETITMEDYIRSQNMVPIKQNMIRQHIKNLLGQFIENDFKSIVVARNREDQKLSEMMSKTLEAALQLNKTHMLDVSVIEEFFISGAFGWKTHYGWHEDKNRDDLIIDSVHPALMFFNTGIKDIRLKEIDFIGEIHDVPIEQVISTFAKNEADRQIIKQWYGHDRRKNRRTAYTSQNQDSSMIDNMDFYTPYDVNMCRVVEIWEKVNMKVMIVYDPIHGKAFQSDMSFEELEEINRQRFEQAIMQGVPEENIPLLDFEERYENIWHFWFLTDRGDILMHGETPYEHEQSPYTLGLYPLVDGNIWGFAYDILDQQIQINRLLTAMDKIVGTSSKGALLLPTQARADGWTNEDYASEMTKSDGVIEYNADPKNNGIKPEELNAKNINIGAIELLQMQMNLLEQISGVTNAIQGQKAGSGTPLGIYQLQTSNAQINNRIYFEFFFQRRSERDLKAVKVIQQYYTEDRNIQITGKDFDDEIKYYEAAKGRDLDIMISMGRATNTPVMRQVQDDILLRFLDQQLIDLDIFTELTSLPFADKLRETINRKQQELEQAQQQAAAQGLPTEADPEAMAALQSAIGMKNGKIPGLQVN